MTGDGGDRPAVEAARDGDEEAFASLVRSHRGLVIGLVAARVRGREDVEDLAQEVFVRAWKRLHTLENPDRFSAWLASIAVHASIDHHRRRGARLKPGPLVEGEEPKADVAPAGRGLEIDEEHRRVLDALEHLDARSRTAVVLRYHEGLAVKEVAARLGDSPAAVAMRLTRALRALRERLE